jgi:hypothetical protein
MLVCRDCSSQNICTVLRLGGGRRHTILVLHPAVVHYADLHTLHALRALALHRLRVRVQPAPRAVCPCARAAFVPHAPTPAQPACRAFADPYVEHDALTLFIDLILLKRDVYRHLLFNRGLGARKASEAAEGVDASRERAETRRRWKQVSDAGARLLGRGPNRVAGTSISHPQTWTSSRCDRCTFVLVLYAFGLTSYVDH